MSTARNNLEPDDSSASSTFSEPLDLEENLARAHDLNCLAQWIARARDQADKLRQCAASDQVLAERLRDNKVAIYSAEWGSAESDALYRLHMIVEETIQQIADATLKSGG